MVQKNTKHMYAESIKHNRNRKGTTKRCFVGGNNMTVQQQSAWWILLAKETYRFLISSHSESLWQHERHWCNPNRSCYVVWLSPCMHRNNYRHVPVRYVHISLGVKAIKVLFIQMIKKSHINLTDILAFWIIFKPSILHCRGTILLRLIFNIYSFIFFFSK